MVGWVTALKLVPWGDVIEATPQILQAAKKLLGATRRAKQRRRHQALSQTPGRKPPCLPMYS